jgi:hypothetical protein
MYKTVSYDVDVLQNSTHLKTQTILRFSCLLNSKIATTTCKIQFNLKLSHFLESGGTGTKVVVGE